MLPDLFRRKIRRKGSPQRLHLALHLRKCNIAATQIGKIVGQTVQIPQQHIGTVSIVANQPGTNLLTGRSRK